MSSELERQLPPALGYVLSQQIVPEGEPTPTQEEVETRLRQFFTAVHEKDVRALNTIRQFVINNEYWDRYEEGRKEYIDTGFLTAEGDGIHIAMIPGADVFRMTHYSKEVLEYSRSIMAPGQSLLSLLRGHFKKNENLLSLGRHGVRPIDHEDRFYDFWAKGHVEVSEISIHSPEDDTFVEDEVRHTIMGAFVQRAQNLAEQATHGEEYRELLNEYTRGAHWPPEVRHKLFTRLLEIQAINGYHGNDINWYAVLPVHLDSEKAFLDEESPWDDAAVIGLRQELQTSAGLEVLRSSVHTTALAARALKALEVKKPYDSGL